MYGLLGKSMMLRMLKVPAGFQLVGGVRHGEGARSTI